MGAGVELLHRLLDRRVLVWSCKRDDLPRVVADLHNGFWDDNLNLADQHRWRAMIDFIDFQFWQSLSFCGFPKSFYQLSNDGLLGGPRERIQLLILGVDDDLRITSHGVDHLQQRSRLNFFDGVSFQDGLRRFFCRLWFGGRCRFGNCLDQCVDTSHPTCCRRHEELFRLVQWLRCSVRPEQWAYFFGDVLRWSLPKWKHDFHNFILPVLVQLIGFDASDQVCRQAFG